MNAMNNMSFYIHKITKNQIDIFSSGGPILDCLSYCFLAEYHTQRIYTSTKGNCNWHVYTNRLLNLDGWRYEPKNIQIKS